MNYENQMRILELERDYNVQSLLNELKTKSLADRDNGFFELKKKLFFYIFEHLDMPVEMVI